jgi:hypothetical protein
MILMLNASILPIPEVAYYTNLEKYRPTLLLSAAVNTIGEEAWISSWAIGICNKLSQD